MTLRVVFGGLSLDVPAGWSNRSTLTFLMPPLETPGGAPLLKRQPGTPASVSIAWRRARPSLADGFAEQIKDVLAAANSSKLLKRGEIEAEGGPMLFAELTVQQQVSVCQLVIVRHVAEIELVVIGSALPALAAAMRERFIDVAKSVRYDGSNGAPLV